MFRNFRQVFCHLESSTLGAQQTWKELASLAESTSCAFSPKVAVDILARFSEEYRLCVTDKRMRREMVNDHSFIKLLSSCVKHMSSFGAHELVRLIHITTVQVEWRDITILRALEPIILEKLPSLRASDIVDCVEAFGKLRCGSRPFWESLISAITSLELSPSETLRVVNLVSENKGYFYKPIFVLSALFPSVQAIVHSGSISNQEIRDVIVAYSDWEKAVVGDVQFFVSEATSRVDPSLFDLIVFSQILTRLAHLRVRSSESASFLSLFQRGLLAEDQIRASPETSVALCESAIALSRFLPHPAVTRDSFVFLEQQLCGQVKKIPEIFLPKTLGVFSQIFELVHLPSGNHIGLPVHGRSHNLLEAAVPVLLRKTAHMQARQLAKTMEAYAIARKGTQELWSSFVTVLGQLLSADGAGDLAPEDVNSLLFALAEMNLDVSPEAKNSLVLAALERVNLFQSFDELVMFAALQLEPQEAASVLKPVIEMMDPETVVESKRPSVVLLNLGLRAVVPRDSLEGPLASILYKTDEDVALFFESAKNIVHPDLWSRLKLDLEGAVGPMEEGKGWLSVDFFSSKRKIAVLVSTPLQVIKDRTSERPSGTAILRHRAVQASLPGWRVINVSASDYAGRGSAVVQESLAQAPEPVVGVTEAGTPEDNDDESEYEFPVDEEENDLSRFLRKDRHAAHRKRAPPAESLPWVPSVLTLKSGRRRKGHRRQHR